MNRRRDDLKGVQHEMFRLISGIYGILNELNFDLNEEQMILVKQLYLSVMSGWIDILINACDYSAIKVPENHNALIKMLEKSTSKAIEYLDKNKSEVSK
jgi:hypothetical protein